MGSIPYFSQTVDLQIVYGDAAATTKRQDKTMKNFWKKIVMNIRHKSWANNILNGLEFIKHSLKEASITISKPAVETIFLTNSYRNLFRNTYKYM